MFRRSTVTVLLSVGLFFGFNAAPRTYYEAPMNGLTHYRVGGSDGNWRDVSTFTAAPSATQDFSFLYMGLSYHDHQRQP